MINMFRPGSGTYNFIYSLSIFKTDHSINLFYCYCYKKITFTPNTFKTINGINIFIYTVIPLYLFFLLQVIEVGKKRADDMKDFISRMVSTIANNESSGGLAQEGKKNPVC